jgi:2-(1,2-epoxy-1,2-dihydrophenyl)acetyl-CoA isomerase
MASSPDELVYTKYGHVATVRLNRPERGNALSRRMRPVLAAAWADLMADDAIRVVVVTGTGDRHFCTGAGLGGAQKPEPARPDGAPERALGDIARLIRQGWQRLIASVLDCEKPVIAAVNGTAAGGGANLVLACDLVVMADTAKLIEVFVTRGIIPDAGGCYLLPRVVGPQRAKEIMFLGDAVTAADCGRYGIANRVVPAADLEATVQELAGRLAAGPSKAIAMTKWLVNRSFESSRHSAFEEEAYAQELVTGTADMAEGIAAFGERRDPRFKGW